MPKKMEKKRPRARQSPVVQEAIILKDMAKALEKDGLNVILSEDVLKIPITADPGSWTCFIRVAQNTLIIMSQIPNVPKNKASQLAQLFSKINYTLLVGNFEFDAGDQDTRFRTTVPLECFQQTEKSFSTLFGYHTSAVYSHFSEIMRLYFNEESTLVEKERVGKDAK